MNDRVRVFRGRDAGDICEVLNYLGDLLGGTVAMVVVQDDNLEMNFLSHPQVAGDLFRQMACVDWADAGRLADQSGS